MIHKIRKSTGSRPENTKKFPKSLGFGERSYNFTKGMSVKCPELYR